MKWTFPSLNLDMSIVANRDIIQKKKKKKKKMVNSVNSDKMSQHLHKYLVWSEELKGLKQCGCVGWSET